ncbi:MAG: TolC family protein, partial [Desulfuromonadaceae bacterium]|nr:TolC family protein [Desulfuromonadaceae bacterium]
VLVTYGVALGICLSVCALPVWSAQDTKAEGINISPSTSTPTPLVSGGISEAEALELALHYHPRLNAFAHATQARTHIVRQAGRVPNPELELVLEDFGGSGAYSGSSNAETSLIVHQRLELGGKGKRRVAVAQADAQLTQQQLTAFTAELRALVRERYVDVMAAQQRLDMAQQQLELCHTMLNMVTERITTGKSATMEQAAFLMQRDEARLRVQQVQHQLRSSQNSLAALWGQYPADVTLVGAALATLPSVPNQAESVDAVEPDWAADLPHSLSHSTDSPELSLARTKVQRATQELRLQQAGRIPDLTLSFGAKQDEVSNDHALIAGVSIEIPLFDRNQDGVAAARARKGEAEALARTVMLQQRNLLQQGWYAFQSARREAEVLRADLLPAAQQNFERIKYAYQAGKYPYQRVLDAQQSLFVMQNRCIDSLASAHKAHIALERLLGTELPKESTTDTAATYRGEA